MTILLLYKIQVQQQLHPAPHLHNLHHQPLQQQQLLPQLLLQQQLLLRQLLLRQLLLQHLHTHQYQVLALHHQVLAIAPEKITEFNKD